MVLQFDAPVALAWGLWGMALFSALWAASVARRITELPFGVAHWAMSFPLAALAVLTLRLAATTTATHHADGELRVALPLAANELQWRDAVQAWLQGEARRVFDERINRFAGRISARYVGWTLSSARSQWGSCTHDGRIRLNWRLIHFALGATTAEAQQLAQQSAALFGEPPA